jgi:hypothetical protein
MAAPRDRNGGWDEQVYYRSPYGLSFGTARERGLGLPSSQSAEHLTREFATLDDNELR